MPPIRAELTDVKVDDWTIQTIRGPPAMSAEAAAAAE